MSSIESWMGLSLVILFALLTLFFSAKKIRTRYPPVFRKIPAILRFRRAIGLAVEDGTRVGVSLGSSSLIEPSSPSSFVGLSALHRIGQLTSTGDLPPIATSGNGGLALLSQDVLRQTAVETNTRELYDPSFAQLTGATPFSYAVGALEAMSEAGIKTNLFIGNFGPEAGFLCDASDQDQTFTLGASDSITAQSIFYALSNEALIGEELYALPAYLAYHPAHQTNLRVQDIFRVVVQVVLIAGALLKVLGLI